MAQKVDIFNYYTLYEDGTLYSNKTKKFKKWCMNGRGYLHAYVFINGKEINVLQHRLLAEHFIENPKFKKEVNHINGIKHDNRLINLEWVTASENMKHAYHTGLRKPNNKKVIDTYTNTVYKSVTEAARVNKIDRGNLSNMLIGRLTNKTNLTFYNN